VKCDNQVHSRSTKPLLKIQLNRQDAKFAKKCKRSRKTANHRVTEDTEKGFSSACVNHVHENSPQTPLHFWDLSVGAVLPHGEGLKNRVLGDRILSQALNTYP
jgi:hypothetical protein